MVGAGLAPALFYTPIMIFVGAGFTPALLFTLPRCLPCPVVYPATFILFLIFLGQG